MFLEKQIGILELFLKDYATLKTGVMMLKIQLWSEELITLENILKLKTMSFLKKLFDQINETLVSIRDLKLLNGSRLRTYFNISVSYLNFL